MNATPKTRLRWYQYSIRSLLVLMVLVACLGSWFAVKKQQVERQRAAAEHLLPFALAVVTLTRRVGPAQPSMRHVIESHVSAQSK
jgi:hypothetical protein